MPAPLMANQTEQAAYVVKGYDIESITGADPLDLTGTKFSTCKIARVSTSRLKVIC